MENIENNLYGLVEVIKPRGGSYTALEKMNNLEEDDVENEDYNPDWDYLIQDEWGNTGDQLACSIIDSNLELEQIGSRCFERLSTEIKVYICNDKYLVDYVSCQQGSYSCAEWITDNMEENDFTEAIKEIIKEYEEEKIINERGDKIMGKVNTKLIKGKFTLDEVNEILNCKNGIMIDENSFTRPFFISGYEDYVQWDMGSIETLEKMKSLTNEEFEQLAEAIKYLMENDLNEVWELFGL